MMASVKERIVNSLNELKEYELKTFKWHLRTPGPLSTSELEKADVLDIVDKIVAFYRPEESVKITVNILRKMNQNHLAEQLEEDDKRNKEKPDDIRLQEFLKSHKSNMKKEAEHFFEDKKGDKGKSNLDDIYTELFITEGDIKDVNREHEILYIDDAFKTQKSQDKPINCNDIFRLRQSNDKNIVVSKGIAGIGKTFSVHKTILDWAEGKGNQDVDCMFLLPCREINLRKDGEFRLHEFLEEFYPELEKVNLISKLFDSCKLMLIFDGLDEFQITLNFNCRKQKSVDRKLSIDILITNLMKGNLLPSALIWVTSRPAAANQIPPEYVGLFTEVRGFTDEQKEKYFRKRIKDKTQASKIISHIKTSRSLYIMCHIPVFCWITATVLQDILIENNTKDIETTLTEMYIHFLIIQMNMKNQKYDEKFEREHTKLLESNKTMIVKLAKLAFEQLKKGNIVFYEEHLKECGIDVSKDFEFTGMTAEIFKKEYGLHETKFFSFVHLSVQEFLAALHVFLSYLNKNMEELQFFFEKPDGPITLHDLLQKAVFKAMGSQRGHLDLFLRFLMGISLESSQKLLKGLITHSEDTTQSIMKTTEHIHVTLEGCRYEKVSVNLFYCLLELKDQSLLKEIQGYLSSNAHSGKSLTSSMCSVLVYVLLMSEKVMDEFNLKMFPTSSSNHRTLVPAARRCKKAKFDSCLLDETCCEIVSSALQSSNSPLRELDLSNNNLQDSGVSLISDALKSTNCHLEILRLAGCRFTGQCCERLSSGLQSSKSLRELDLSNNDLQDSGVNLISDALKSTNCHLEILRLSICNLTGQCCESLSSVLQSSNSLRELDLSNNDLQDSGVKLLSDALKSPHCTLQILRLSGCMVTEEGCSSVSSVLSLKHSHLRELDLSYNHPGESGDKLLSERLDDPNCTLDKVNVLHGGELRIRAGLHKYVCDLTLDSNTVNTDFVLSEGDRKLTRVRHKNTERFENSHQVLCKEILTGRCYWETEWSGLAEIAVTYKEKEKWHYCGFGLNGNSWRLVCYNDELIFSYNFNSGVSRPSHGCKRVGVYVDCPAGILSFYRVSDTHTLTLLHTLNTTFTRPLYAGFKLLCSDSSVKLIIRDTHTQLDE